MPLTIVASSLQPFEISVSGADGMLLFGVSTVSVRVSGLVLTYEEIIVLKRYFFIFGGYSVRKRFRSRDAPGIDISPTCTSFLFFNRL